MNFSQANLSETFMQQAEDHIAYRIGDFIQVYVQAILFPIGLVGNSLSLAVMLMKDNRKISCCIYMAAMSIIDNAVLLFYGGTWVAYTFFRVEDFMNDHSCRAMLFFYNVLSLLEGFVVMAITIDRFIAVQFPLKAKVLCTSTRSKITLCSLTGAALVYCVPYLFIGHLDRATCAFTVGADSVLKTLLTAHMICTLVLGAVLPFVSLAGFNCAILWALNKKREMRSSAADGQVAREQKAETGEDNEGNSDQENTGSLSKCGRFRNLVTTIMCASLLKCRKRKSYMPENHCLEELEPNAACEGVKIAEKCSTELKDLAQPPLKKPAESCRPAAAKKPPKSYNRQLTVMLLLVTFTMLLLAMPKYVVRIVYSFFVEYYASPSVYAYYHLFNMCAKVAIVINSTINVFLYCVAGSKFRQQLKQLLLCKS